MTEDIDFRALAAERHINTIVSINKGIVEAADFYRMVAAVEESNAVFEAFYVRDLPGRPASLLNYPVFYTDRVEDGEMFGGMWSCYENGKPKYPAAFVRLVFHGDKS